MKCVRSRMDGSIARISNELAAHAVKTGRCEYIPKHIWKKEVRDNG